MTKTSSKQKTRSATNEIISIDDNLLSPVTQVANSISSDSTVTHPIPPVWNSESRILILGTMPSPKSREAGFYYMHPQNRFWNVIAEVFGEELVFSNNALKSTTKLNTQNIITPSGIPSAITERRDFLLRHHIAMWDVLASCQIEGAADSSIKNAVPNDFTQIFEGSNIHHVFCTGKTAFALWKKHCSALYENRFNLTVHCLPSTSPANAQWNKEKLVEEYKVIARI